jgi:transposase
MDVHKENYTVCSYSLEHDKLEYEQKLSPNYKLIVKYIERIRSQSTEELEFICGYEAGSLGYSLYHQLTKQGVRCVILAPSTMGIVSKKVKTDKRDAGNIARCMAFNTYSAVHVPTPEDESVREYIRMRNSHKTAQKRVKQQILALVRRQGCCYNSGTKTSNYWTKKHVAWLQSLNLGGALQETLSEYLITYSYLRDKIERLDRRIEELANSESYQAKVKKLICLLGVQVYTALSIIVEIGDFNRFAKAGNLASYLGLVPGEHSSGARQRRLGITKAGNSHARRLLVEAAHAHNKGAIGYKSKDLKQRQKGNSPEVIAYADKANERLRRKYYKMVLKNHSESNVAKVAVARELSCFIWGLMTEHLA